MKFSSLAIASSAVFGGVTEATTSFNSHQIQSRLNKVNKRALLRSARKLEDKDDEEDDEGWQVSGDYSIHFNECLTLNVMSEQEEENNEDQNDAQMDDIQPIKDYVIIDVINSYDGSIVNYAVDLVTFVTTLANYIPDQQQDYCEACDYDYCYPNEDADEQEQEDEDSNEEEDDKDENDRRKLANRGKIVYTDCTTCESMSCFQDEGEDENQGDDVYTSEAAVEWLLNVGECQEIDEDNYGYQNEDGNALYAGFTCNSDGTGMEIGVFQDDECSQLTDTSYTNIIANGGMAATYQQMTKGLVLRTFIQYFDCMDTEFVSPGEDQGDENEDEDEADDFEGSEYCQALVQDNAVAMGESCYEEDADEDEDKYGYDENGNPWGQTQDANGNIVYYDIQDDEDVEQICVAIQSKNGDYQTAHQGGSNLYNYKSGLDNGDDWDWDTGKEGQNNSSWWSNAKNKMDETLSNIQKSTGLSVLGIIGAIVGGALLLIGVIVAYKKSKNSKKKASLELDYVENSRREPLVSNPEVYIA